MRAKFFLVTLCGLLFLLIGCGAVNALNPVSGGGNFHVVNSLWSDVPRMDGLTPSTTDFPLAGKLILRAALGNLGRLNKPGEDQTTGNVDWLVFTTPQTPDDVKGFYTNQRMTDFGAWDPSKNSTCLDGSQFGFAQFKTLCLFEKQQNGTLSQLVIIAAPDDTTKQTDVFFLRLETQATPVAQSAPTVNANPPTRGVITALNGTAPYGIEKRPMPTGLDLDQLLPKQVGPFTRAVLEKSEQRGVVPTSIQVDGNSVYATYRSGSQEIFVEFAVNSSAANAQSTLDVAAGDAAGGVFPTDPRMGSRGTEPSYLQVVNSDGAFFAWTRGGYYFSADAKGGATDLDAFMNAFPY